MAARIGTPSRTATPRSNLGRHLFGVAALALGLVTLAWPGYDDWLRPSFAGNAQSWRVFAYAAAAAQILGGAAIQFRRTKKTGALILGTVYVIFASLCVPRIVAAPQTYDRWGNFFEQFCLFTGAALVYARSVSARAPQRIHRIGRILLGTCAVSFTLEQAVHLDVTASLVPKWLPPSQMFWTLTTTVFFALAALALLTNRGALLATRLLTMMLVLFGILVWVPLLLSHPHSQANLGEAAETFAIAGTAWILADLLGEYRRKDHERREA